jgi:endonuclease YncB( thermonuclease family)
MYKIVFCFILFVQIISCRDPKGKVESEFTGKVVSIADGDTFTLLTEEKEQIKIRLHGIDCPENKQDFGQVAKQKLSDLIYARIVHAVKKDIDRYGRVVAVVYNGNNCINEEMLKSGLAWHYTRYDHNPEWQRMEDSARTNGLGLWAQPYAIPPWEWRRK